MDVIHLHDIIVKASSLKNKDILDNVQLSAQLTVDGEVIGETKPVQCELNELETLWRLEGSIHLPASTLCFTIAIMQNAADNHSGQLGSITLSNKIVLDQSVKQEPGGVKYDLGRFYHPEHSKGFVAFSVQFSKEDDSGPLLGMESALSATFYALVTSGVSTLYGTGDVSLEDELVPHVLDHMLNTVKSKGQVGEDLTKMVHNRVLLLSNTSEKKPHFLNKVGSIYLNTYKNMHGMDHLDQAISVYNASIQLVQESNPMRGNFLADLGMSLLCRFEQLHELSDINKAILMLEKAVDLTPDDHANKLLRLNNLSNSLRHRYSHSGDYHDMNKAILMLERAVNILPDGHVNKPPRLNNLGILLAQHGDCNKAVAILEKAVDSTPSGHTSLHSFMCNLGNALFCRFEQLHDLEDINKAILIYEKALDLTPAGHASKPSRMDLLGNLLVGRFEQLHNPSDINKAVLILEEAVELIPDGHVNKPAMLGNLGMSLKHKFEQLGGTDNINRSISMLEKAVDFTPDGQGIKLSRMGNLAILLAQRFQQLHNLSDINRSISMLEKAVYLIPDGHADQASALSNLGRSLLYRFEQSSDPSDINNAVAVFEKSVNLTSDGHAEKPLRLKNLGESLLRHAEQFNDLRALSRAVAFQEKAVELTPDGHHDKPSRLNDLGASLLHQLDMFGDTSIIQKTVSTLEKSVDLTPDGDAETSSRLNNLGKSLLHRFEWSGSLGDINKAVFLHEKAVQLTPDGHADMPRRLSSLGLSLECRFAQLKDLSDINQAVWFCAQAVELTPDGHVNKVSRLSHLGKSLLTRFNNFGNSSDLNKTIVAFEKAVELTPDGHAYKLPTLNNLANSLACRFELLANFNDINQAILLLEKVVELTPDSIAEKPKMLNTLGNSLLRRFEQSGDLSDINRSVLLREKAVDLIPGGHADKPTMLNNLGNSLLYRFNKQDNYHDLDTAISHWSTAACYNIGSTSIKFTACVLWAQFAYCFSHYSTLQAYTVAFNLLPQLTWLGLSMQDRQRNLLDVGSAVRNAVAAAITEGQCQTALEWLEQGRSVIWGQLLQLRTPADDLRQENPVLASQLEQLSKQLEGAGTQPNLTHISLIAHQPSLKTVTHRYHDLAFEREELIKKVRMLEGFDRFLLPQTCSNLLLAANAGVVVTINVSAERCDALVIMPDLSDVLHIHLDQFTYDQAEELYKSLRALLKKEGVFRNAGRAGRISEPHLSNSETGFAYILSALWFGIAKPVLDGLAITTSNLPTHKLPHVWWCLTGPLAFLPIHAAGLYRKGEKSGSKLSDFVVSSYTPTLTALINASSAHPLQKAKLLTVALPTEAGLPCTQEELDRIDKHTGNFAISRLVESRATVEKVVQGMEECSWVHFACHGMQATNPTESALLLAGHSKLTLSDITKLSLPHAELAFLSACQTATGAENLAEEAVHLAAGMLLVGYRGVIATMWSIQDADGPRVADDVYGHLFKDSQPDATQAAYALHIAVQKLRKQSKSFISWVPFIHIGV